MPHKPATYCQLEKFSVACLLLIGIGVLGDPECLAGQQPGVQNTTQAEVTVVEAPGGLRAVQPTEYRVSNSPGTASRYSRLLQQAQKFEEENSLIRLIYETCLPTVVHIDAQKSIRKSGSSPVRIEEAGAGVIFQHGSGTYVLTNRHLVADARLEDIRIQLADGTFFRPTEIRSDRETDLAVIYTRQPGLVAARIGDSQQVRIGDYVVAVGSPFGLNHSVSLGIISARGRRDLDLGDAGVRLQNFFQTDAAINPGNSGGPLMNLRGEVIGINTAIASNSGHNEGIGFAIPINMARQVAADLIDHGKVQRGYLGVSLDSRYTPEQAESLGLSTVYGTRVTAITPDSPAARADIRLGDVILVYDGKTIENDSHLVNEVSLTRGGRDVLLTVFRQGRKLDVTVRVEFRD